ncbi:MAG: hypothetical protein EBV83_00475 [Verrucomicrobia bacterium]|nr:hypothetical protein [Verrucomicrobiota bacterium]
MSRKAHRPSNRKLLGGIFAAFILLAALGSLLLEKAMDPFRTVERIKPADFYENANSLRGNIYQVDGVIMGSLGWSPQKGRLFSLRVTADGQDWPLPILVPAPLARLNLQKGQRYRVKVRVDESGLLVVEEMDKK